MSVQPTPEKNPSASLRNYKIAVVALALAVVVLGYFVLTGQRTITQQTENVSSLEVEKLELTNELQDMLIQYDTLTVKNDKMEAEINAQQEQIRDMLKQIEKHKDDAYIISKLKKEASTLRQIMKGYLATIDSLNTLNVGLRADKELLSQELTSQQQRARELENENQSLEQIVTTGSVIPAQSVQATGIKVRNNGSQVEVKRAKQTEMIKVCAIMGENRITPAGRKNLYVRIISPDGVVLDDGQSTDNLFEFNGVSGKYSLKRPFDYENRAVDVCGFLTVPGELATGQYIVELYESGTEIARTTLDLK